MCVWVGGCLFTHLKSFKKWGTQGKQKDPRLVNKLIRSLSHQTKTDWKARSDLSTDYSTGTFRVHFLTAWAIKEGLMFLIAITCDRMNTLHQACHSMRKYEGISKDSFEQHSIISPPKKTRKT